MTKRERAQVVELLRCCADLNWTWITVGMLLDAPWRIQDLASDALDAVWRRSDDYVYLCLEAAARVEEGSWP